MNKNSYIERRTKIFESHEDYETRMMTQSLNNQWILDIFDHKDSNENQKILYEDENYVLFPDIKSDFRKKHKIKLLALFKNLSLRSIRDLRSEHIDLLQHVYSTSVQIIRDIFHINESEIRAYFHYYPTNYTLHLHFAYTNTWKTYTCNNHLFRNVINNLKSDPNYYVNNKIEVLVGEKPV